MSALEYSHSTPRGVVAPPVLRMSSESSNEFKRADIKEGFVGCRRIPRLGVPRVRDKDVVEEIRDEIGASISSTIIPSSMMFSNETPRDGSRLKLI